MRDALRTNLTLVSGLRSWKKTQEEYNTRLQIIGKDPEKKFKKHYTEGNYKELFECITAKINCNVFSQE